MEPVSKSKSPRSGGMACKKPYRSEFQIISDVLGTLNAGGEEGAKISEVTRKANLSHYQALEKLEKLKASGLVMEVRRDRNRFFRLTSPNGTQFFQRLGQYGEGGGTITLRY